MATHTAMAQGSDALMRSSLEQRLGIIHFVSAKEHGWSGQSRTSGKIETTTGPDDSIKATVPRQRGGRSANAGIRNNGQNPMQGNQGPYLHFSLYKENKDTMDALNHMAKTLRIHPKAFGAAGTKDRRAVTVQRVSIKGRSPASLIVVNERINNLKIGDFNYAQDPIRLNDHDGNEFVIVLKNCVFSGTENLSFEETLDVAKSTIDSALTQVIRRGFINYYGTQRFGTHQIGTQEVGMKILKEDFAGAIQALLSYEPLLLSDSQDQGQIKGVHREDINRARACSIFLETKDSKAAFDHLPPRCHVEKAIIQHLSKSPTDFVGALMSINRSMRTMYGHAYQSLVWNFVASKRWERFGDQVVNGDLVLVKSKSAALRRHDDGKETEGSLAWNEDIAAAQNSGFVPHAITEDDLLDRKYSIYDIVLPSPGWDVIYPANEIGDFYAEFMGRPENGGLDPHNMRRRQRDFSLPGSYRKLMGKLKRVPTASVQAYSNDLEQLVPTDLDIIRARKSRETAECNADQQSSTTSWRDFTQNVRQNELEEAKAKIGHRKSEDPTPTTRINDTWVQTSVDGSNKRIKIAKHSDVIANKPESIVTTGDTPMQVDIVQDEAPADINTDRIVNDQRDEIDGVQAQQLVHQTLASSIIAAATAQPEHQELRSPRSQASLQLTNGEATLIPNTSNEVQQTPSTSNYPQFDTNSVSNQSPADPQLTNGSCDPTSIVATDILEPEAETKTTASSDSTDAKKIAVILRFALDTSQYATIVIRELQGAFKTDRNSA
ncbi:hypothetical protein ONZ43_g1984 [Nemania bipapillata]|uniref:Uncharacterized protein n=1 Tax=Nemania bipapillata TaxID=110536 RepID=A0ACC2J2B2_9PEZI|nr:hypothetical protein ONZ43_g1984 [Nemania bipapillata]